MLKSHRLTLVVLSGLLFLVAACGGGGASPDSEEGVRDDAEAFLNAFFGDDVDADELEKHFPEECPQDAGELALGIAFAQAFLGDIDIEFEITDVELMENDRALVTITGSGDFLDLLGDVADDGDAESQELWVLQEGVWRSTSDCEAFDDEREALGLSTTTADFDSDFSSGFGSDFGPPVAASLDEPLAVGDLIVTVHGATLSSEAVTAFGDPPQGVYVVVDFTFANDGREPTSPWWSLDLQLFDDQDRTWEAADIPSEDVGPGFSGEYQASWDVPTDATGFRLVVSADTFGGQTLPDDFAPWEVSLGALE